MNDSQTSLSLHPLALASASSPRGTALRSATWPQGVAARLRGWRQMSLAPVWCLLAVLLVAVSWLLPNHAQPWLAFHSDAWMALALALIAAVVLARTRELAWSWFDVAVAAAAAIPMTQYLAGLLPFAGQAWASTAYLLGFLVAILVGRQWNSWRPLWMGDMLFGSFLVAAIVSVGLQLYQWTGMTADQDLLDIWVYWLSGNRPYGNMAQPNQMASLLLWGLIGCGWLVQRGHVRWQVGAACALFVTVGLALTQSRTGLLGLVAIVAAAWWWRGAWTQRYTPHFVSALVPFFFGAMKVIAWGSSALLLDPHNSMANRVVHELRPALWSTFTDAAWQRPWSGYGWNQGLSAHLAVADRHTNLPMAFGQAHNLLLDFVVWAGIPLGLALAAACLAWALVAVRRVRTAPQVLYLLVLLTIGAHSMLEFPLHYAYFLLPAGLVVGALSGELKTWLPRPAARGAWRATVVLFCGSVLLLAAIVYDYFKVESSTLDIRMKMAAVHSAPEAPEVLVLTQFPAMIEFALRDPAVPATREELQRARDAAGLWITQQNLSKITVMLALNGHVPEARCWMVKAGVLLGPDTGEFLRASWPVYQQAFAALRALSWPAPAESAAVCDAVKQEPLGPWPHVGR